MGPTVSSGPGRRDAGGVMARWRGLTTGTTTCTTSRSSSGRPAGLRRRARGRLRGRPAGQQARRALRGGHRDRPGRADDRAGTVQGAGGRPGPDDGGRSGLPGLPGGRRQLRLRCANTSLHHMDFTAALAAMARALRPGGRLAVVGLAADSRSATTWPTRPGSRSTSSTGPSTARVTRAHPSTWDPAADAGRVRLPLLAALEQTARLTRCPGRDPLPDHAPEFGVRREVAGGDDGA